MLLRMLASTATNHWQTSWLLVPEYIPNPTATQTLGTEAIIALTNDTQNLCTCCSSSQSEAPDVYVKKVSSTTPGLVYCCSTGRVVAGCLPFHLDSRRLLLHRRHASIPSHRCGSVHHVRGFPDWAADSAGSECSCWLWILEPCRYTLSFM